MTDVVGQSQAVLALHAKSFRFAAWFLPRRARDDAAVAYAFCRRIDDAVDEANDPLSAARRLTELETMMRGRQDPDPLTQCYLDLCKRVGIGVEPGLDLIRGARMDLAEVRFASDEQLGEYCYCVAGTVGLMMCGILGVRSTSARRHAVALGVAMQLTNICRDVREDALRGRVYLPAQRLRRAGASTEDVLSLALERPNTATRPSETELAIRGTVRQLLRMADVFYRRGARGYRYLPGRTRLAIMVASQLYRGIGKRLERVAACDPRAERVYLPLSSKIWLTGIELFRWLSGLLSPLSFSRKFREAPPSLGEGNSPGVLPMR